MAGAVINAILLGVTGVAMIPLFESFFPPNDIAVTTVRITAGQTKEGDSGASTGGARPGVALFDVVGQRIGFERGVGQSIGDGQFVDVKVHPFDANNNRPPEYVSISASGSDAFCVSNIAVTGPSNDYFTWNGEFAKSCGATWYESKGLMQGTTSARPSCVWMSNDGRFPMGFSMRLVDFASADSASGSSRGQQYIDHPESLCNSPARQGIWQTLTEFNCIPHFTTIPTVATDGSDADLTQVVNVGDVACDPGPNIMPTDEQIQTVNPDNGLGRRHRSLIDRRIKPFYLMHKPGNSTHHGNGTQTHEPHCKNKLVISDYESSSAKRLCESKTSWGPDFVSTVEKFYCDMCKHDLYPLCSLKVKEGCFDIDTRELRSNRMMRYRDGSQRAFTPSKSFTNVDHWK